ncbi:hypothetical protein [Chryseobacterium sp. EO14]|uniref:hypothetical protein n=1 Tax=Chryseobacterium sp. EO14 TaxID=2950551 RepID=UPI002109D8A1|nr:hypothetical protein [Chryseobacterium sp. EO14]MCQ4142453.1 hypothetical protein [Chryseobacterium sp. EO14]
MKKSILLATILLSTCASSQVAVGKSSVTNNSVSLEFGSDNRGIVLPWVTSAGAVAGAVNGTLIFDISDKKVKVKYASGWKDLSVDSTGTVDTSLQDNKTENNNAKVEITSGVNISSTPGILVLADSNKAMILPKVATPHLNIINPAAGMMAYDTVNDQLAVFNGTVWSFWKP